jgi:hypothetical protein
MLTLSSIAPLWVVADQQLRQVAYYDEDDTYEYVYICLAEPDVLTTTAQWRVQKIIYLKADPEPIYLKKCFPISSLTMKWSNDFEFLATDLAYVKSLFYVEN